LQSSLGRGKSWALAENISSQTGKNISSPTWKIFQQQPLSPHHHVSEAQADCGRQTRFTNWFVGGRKLFLKKNLTKNMFDNCTAKIS